MLTMYYQTSSVVRRMEENVIDFTAYLPERRFPEPVCRPLTWDTARPVRRRKRKTAALYRAAELGAALALFAAALTVPLCLFLL
jgi:hypothetical protein